MNMAASFSGLVFYMVRACGKIKPSEIRGDAPAFPIAVPRRFGALGAADLLWKGLLLSLRPARFGFRPGSVASGTDSRSNFGFGQGVCCVTHGGSHA
jgi:hypothetical protein